MKTAIYLRVSTKEQHPEIQKAECVRFAEARGYDIEEIYLEKISGFKDVTRPKYEEIKSKAYKGEINAVVVWALDRWTRNRDVLLDDITKLRGWGCKIHSVKEQYLESINTFEGSMGKTILEFLLGLIGTMAEMESMRKSERIKMAYNSYKGNSWGRKEIQSQIQEEVLLLHRQGKTIRQIAKAVTYRGKNSNKKNPSIGVVHKCIKNFNKGNGL